jgi:hypothetical protein
MHGWRRVDGISPSTWRGGRTESSGSGSPTRATPTS